MHNPAPSPATASPTDGECSGHRRRHRTAATHGCTRPCTTHRQRLGTPHTCSLSRASEPVAGDCDFGRVVDGKLLTRPVWRLLTVSPHVAESIASALGAEPQRRLANGSELFEVVAEKASLRVVVENPGRLTGQMKLWDSRGLAHHCDGRAFLSREADAGHPCGCPNTMAERRARARAGQGPQPITTLLFRLAECPDIDSFRFRSSSWRFAEGVQRTRTQLAAVGDAALCELAIQTVEFPTQNGRRVCYHKPVVKVLSPWVSSAALSLAA
ncbi:hypothetical protein SGFS_060880 [Streptomyces graminofaciens]|uniref:Uncharacterized protein n=1 Tax=Streptomyces graminofaciens TaxID=68212 RepID=A0ABN5VN74_9ACTN|nr:hypothetical protein [Streptomyces graminofaciens]BBC34794.1 hypothetical protein SGFS_060880 [Streptomyces graminofaciens]